MTSLDAVDVFSSLLVNLTMFGRLFGSTDNDKKETLIPSRVDKVEISVYLESTYPYKFPSDFEDRMDNATFSSITRSINEINDDIGLDLKKKANCWEKIFGWNIAVLVIGFMVGFPCTFVGASRGPEVLLYVGIIGIVLFIAGTCGFYIYPSKSGHYNDQRYKLLVNELNKKLEIMNKRTQNQMVLSYSYDRKLVIELKVDKINLPNNILYIPNNYGYGSMEQYDSNNNNNNNDRNATNNISLQTVQASTNDNKEEIVVLQMPDGRTVAAKVIGNVNTNNNVNIINNSNRPKEGDGQRNVVTMQ